MHFKLDENLGARIYRRFVESGHKVQTVRQQSLQGVSDQQLFEVCCDEQRCLVTLDLDFSNTLRFPPELSGGIVVIRIPRNPSLDLLEQMVSQFLKLVEHTSPKQKLWIVEVGRVRVRQTDE